MDSRRFTTLSEQRHKEWLSRALDIPENEDLGIDLIDGSVGVEMKDRKGGQAAYAAILSSSSRETA